VYPAIACFTRMRAFLTRSIGQHVVLPVVPAAYCQRQYHNKPVTTPDHSEEH
jgi:hypothetical protein